MSTEELFEEVAAWALQQDRFITSLQLCDQFNVSMPVSGRLLRKLITHPRITSEFKREKCIISDGQAMTMLMVRVIKIARVPMGPPKPAKLPKPPKPKVVVIPQPKDEVVVKKLRKLVANMPR
ncbi:hypothetical protein [Aeromonas veronii]|uniref:hypothetical protein n=2 Tax=Aeromonadaceae TaxID=84642 RepID=UPI0018807CEA|nr:hypothetical protein [Aeromonas veronii]MBE8733930.1 hypothetical protein [Aeromonas veronii]MBE8738321.1 hypothetical protein [Aeromonas veronii]MBE8741916.1 hypothetical protein [Aeromonas veronii]MBE8763266.1 hypothetical protein [Aeromonas veronii]MBE8837878.1 hypothetical protein [Aeromonas veronii]